MHAKDRIRISISAANQDPVELGLGFRFDREVKRTITLPWVLTAASGRASPAMRSA